MKRAICNVVLMWGILGTLMHVMVIGICMGIVCLKMEDAAYAPMVLMFSIYGLLICISLWYIGETGTIELDEEDRKHKEHEKELQAELDLLKPKKPVEVKIAPPPAPPIQKPAKKTPDDWNADPDYDKYVKSRDNLR